MDAADVVKEALRMPGRCVLASIVDVAGHAYRKAGSMMVLAEGGGKEGSLSPGCLEADLAAYVPAVLGGGKPQQVLYDMTSVDDFSWGEAIGCGGKITILLEPVTGPLLKALSEAGELLEKGGSVIFVRHMDDSLLPSRYSALLADRTSLLAHDELSAAVVRPIHTKETSLAAQSEHSEQSSGAVKRTHVNQSARDSSWSQMGQSGVKSDSLSITEDNNIVMLWHPKPRLVLFGAGDDAKPVCDLALRAGFRVTVADFREGVCKAERFPGAEIVCGFPSELRGKLDVGEGDYVVIMSHQFQRDGEFLEFALAGSPRYIGLMGSTSRTERMLGGKPAPSMLHYPVGLPIAGDGPEEIAISIAAELISVRRGRMKHGERDSGIVPRSRERKPDGAKQA
ncbi:XdhC family protein [Paenibacillus sp. CAU 1782]